MTISKLLPGFIEYLEKKNRSPRTIEEYKRFLYGPIEEAVGNREISEICLSDSAEIEEAAMDYGRTAPQRAVVDFRMLLRWAKRAGYQVAVDYRDLDVPKLPKPEVIYYTKDEEELIRQSLRLDPERYSLLKLRDSKRIADRYKMATLRMAAYFELYLATGLRLSEGTVLMKSDITWGSPGEIRAYNCKTKEYEKLYLNDIAQQKLREYFKERTDNLPYVFISSDNHDRPMTSYAARKWLRVHGKKLGLSKRLNSRTCRKTYTTKMLLGGADIKTVQVLSRHESPTTTLNHYAAVVKEQCRSMYQKTMNSMVTA